jgi:glycosyltransferase involved in cell wall biosynthesis
MTTLLAINNYHYYRGGAETVFLEHNRMFEALGWSVIPFSMHHAKNLPTPWSEYFVDEIEFGQSYSLASRVNLASKVIYSFEARRKLGRLLDRVRPDVCHAHNIYHHISPSILGLLKRRGIPTVITLHDLKLACPAYLMLAPDGICERCKGGRLYNVVLHRCIKGSAALSAVVMTEAIVHRLLGSYRDCVERFIVPSRFLMDKLAEWGIPKSQFRYVRNFIDIDRYRPQYAPGKAFVYLGRVSREKGIATLIRASASARVPLVVVGTGPELEEMQRLAARLAAEVTFAGYLTGGALHDAVRSARALVLPSECYENAPMSVLEAYGLGKPVIGTRIGGIPELIREQETGLVVPSGDPDSLAAALRDMAARPDADIEAMGRRGRGWVENEFTAGVYRDRMIDVYRELGVAVSTPALPATL